MIQYIIFSIFAFIFFAKSAQVLLRVKDAEKNLDDYKSGKRKDLFGLIWFAGPNAWSQRAMIQMFGKKFLLINIKIGGAACALASIGTILSIFLYAGL
ncbi:hypothetical protein HOD30_04285 [Candidatus Peregrinibacteria bacterium]|jgi:hypothetical protein|nr:hypothetical protein [Candidatus Peregrinibacteria bacterium]MBT4632177.1 hypothetical protein [Candidatus Peregrinibacteria bacterium]MBT5516738.1 hypothetical protein [Candidatus Peregrinibacteria bacterium]MBT5824095.1 hypothetical protein [Candidatus Peregrinibacteria bacterium]